MAHMPGRIKDMLIWVFLEKRYMTVSMNLLRFKESSRWKLYPWFILFPEVNPNSHVESKPNFTNEACGLGSYIRIKKSMNTCIDVLAGLGRMHGAMAHRWLHCRLWLYDSSAGKELVDGGTEVHYLSWLQWPVIQLGLPHALPQSYGANTK